MKRRKVGLCAWLITLLLLCWISSVSHASANDEHSLLSVRDVVLVITRFLDFSDLKVIQQVCTLFEKYSKMSVSLRSSQSLITDTERIHFLECDNKKDLYELSQISGKLANQWSVIEICKKYLFVRGIGEDEKPRYMGRVKVKRKVDVLFDDFTLLSGRVWISEPKKDRVLNLHTGEILYFSHTFCVINLPYLVIFQGSFFNLYRWNRDCHILERVSGDLCFSLVHLVDRERARLYCRKGSNTHQDCSSSSEKLPLMILPWIKNSREYGIVDFETGIINEKGINGEKIWPAKRQWLESDQPRAACVSRRIQYLRIVNPMTERVLVESVIPVKPGMLEYNDDIHGHSVIKGYDLCCNRRYGLFALGSMCYIFDLQTGEMIGPETEADGWVSEELFHVPDQKQFTVRSVHQPRENIPCVMVDEDGTETPMMDKDFIEKASDILYDCRNNQLLTVEWE